MTSAPAASAVDFRLSFCNFFLCLSFAFDGGVSGTKANSLPVVSTPAVEGKGRGTAGAVLSQWIAASKDVVEVIADADSIFADMGDGTFVDEVGSTSSGLPSLWAAVRKGNLGSCLSWFSAV